MSIGPVMIVVQARLGSTRLPGKVLKTVLGKTLLEFLFERLKRAASCDGIVIATTTNPADDAIVLHGAKMGAKIFRGSEDNVLERYFLAAQKHGAKTVVRVTADCPLLDPAIIDLAVNFYEEHPEYGFVTNSPAEGELRTYPRGMDVEVFSFKALEEACQGAKLPAELEHVTPYFRNRPHHYRQHYLQLDHDLSDWRLTVDTPEDFELIRLILEDLYPRENKFSFADLCETINAHREWLLLNRDVRQKEA